MVLRLEPTAPVWSHTNVPHQEAPVAAHVPARHGRHAGAALPRVDGPAQTLLPKTAAAPKTRFGCIYVPHGATMDKWTPAGEGRDFAALGEPEPARKATGSHLRGQQPGARQRHRRRRRRRARALGGDLPERRASRRRTPCASASRSIRCWPTHIGQDTPLPSLELGIEEVEPELRRRLRLRLLQHHLLAHADGAAAGGEQPAGRVREALRRRHDRRSASRASARIAASSTRSATEVALRRARCPPPTACASATISTTSARSNGASRRCSSASSPPPAERAGRAGRHARGLRGARQADVRPADARLPERDHAGLDADVRART